MPTFTDVGRRDYDMALRDLNREENATGISAASGDVGTSVLLGRTLFAGVLTPSSHETLGGAELGIDLPTGALVLAGRGVIFIVLDTPTPDSEEVIRSFSHGYMGYDVGDPEPPDQPVEAPLSPVIRTQLDEIVLSISPRLQERLNLFRTGRPGQNAMLETTMSEVEDLAGWLCSESDLVSSTVSDDGMLTIAVDFPDDVRLYIEVERDGSAEAAVIKGKLDVSEIPGHTVAALTSEVILAAVANV